MEGGADIVNGVGTLPKTSELVAFDGLYVGCQIHFSSLHHFFSTKHDYDDCHDDDEEDLEGNGWVDDMLLHQVRAREPMPLAAPATKNDKIYSVGCFHSFTPQFVNSRLSSDSIILFSLSR